MTRDRGPLRRVPRRWKDGWIADPDGPGARRSKTIDMLLFDHGLLRKAWRNQHEVAPGVWRSSQPDPGMIRRLAAQGVKAIVNLRGAATGVLHFLLDRYAADSAGEPMRFREWVERRYDPEALMAAYEADPAASFVVDRLLRRE